MPEEAKPRSDKDIADLLYGPGKPKEEVVVEPEPQVGEVNPNFGKRSDAELAAIIYPPQNPAYANVDGEGNVSAVIRELVSGRIMEQSRYGTPADLAGRGAILPNADLSGLDLVGKSFNHGNYHDASLVGSDCRGLSGTWADLRNVNARGTNFAKANLGFSDLRGMKVDSETDITGTNFTGAAIDKETYDSLVKCKGASSAVDLDVRAMPKSRKR